MPIKWLIMIATCSELDLQSPDLHPIRALGIPELLHSNVGRLSSLICLLEHCIHVLIRGEEKYADLLLWQIAIEAQYTQHSMKRVEWR
jgi:hypothetical protein